MAPIKFRNRLNSVPDPHLKIRGVGARSSRPLGKGGGGALSKTFFRPFGPQFGLKTKGAGRQGPSAGSATVINSINPIYIQKGAIQL